MSHAAASTKNTTGVRPLGGYYASRISPMHGMKLSGVSIASTKNTMGVRPLGGYYASRTSPMHGMGGMIALGSAPDPDTITALVSNGYDPGWVNTAVAMGATDEQLLALPYPVGPDEMAAAEAQLMGQLGGVSPATGSSMSTAPLFQQQVASAVISSSFGSLDLSSVGIWQQIAGYFNQVGAALQRLAASGDSQAQAYKSQYNSLLSQFNSVWNAAMPNSSAGISTLSGMGDVSTLATTSVIVIAGTAVALTVGLPITLTVGSILAGLYVIYQYVQSKNAATAVTQTQANTQAAAAASSASTIASMQAQAKTLQNQAIGIQGSNPTLAAQYTAQANTLLGQAAALSGQLTSASGVSNWSLWLQNNWMLLAIAAVAVVAVPPLIKKL